MARPTFAVDTTRLRALREQNGLTQASLASQVAQKLNKPDTDARHYQRIEETGRTSRAYATALAEILGVSLPLLQGLASPEPGLYLQRMRALLAQRLASGENEALRKFWAGYGSMESEEALGYLAEDIAERIESVQLVRNPTKIAELVRLTGLAETDLLEPANVQGFWFLSVSSDLVSQAELVNGVASLNYRIGELMRGYLPQNGGDSTVRMWYDKPWVRIEVRRQRNQRTMLIDCTRCQPDATGLRWTAPSWYDEIFLEPGVTAAAFASADVVTDFTGHTTPEDVDRLRLVVDEHDGNDNVALRRTVVGGLIDEVPPTVKANFASEGSSRFLYLKLLSDGLQETLMPCLAAGATRGWSVKVSGTAVDIRLKDSRNRGFLYDELRYRIRLVEQTGTGECRTVPVREQELEKLKEDIEAWSKAPADMAAGAGDRSADEAI